MKRIISLLLCAAMMLTGCATVENAESQSTTVVSQVDISQASDVTTESKSEIVEWKDVDVQYDSLDDKLLLAHIEDLIYSETVRNLNSEKYFVENVSAVYISKEYLEEVAYNSQSNIYFGYTLAELNDLFQGTRYVFTLGEDGKTTVKELVEIQDTTNEEILKNVAIGTGVILICVTVSVVTGGSGAPAISAIFAASAKTGAIMAVSSAAIGGVSAGVVRGVETGDMNEALEAAALAGSEEFKWGAIGGAIAGGAIETVKYTNALKSLKLTKLNGITKQEAAAIQMESNLPMDVIAQFHSMDEYLVYKKAGLKAVMVNGRTALVQNIDLNYVSELPDGSVVTNLVRMQKGYAPIDPVTQKAYQLHHIGQKADGTLAVLTETQHQGNSAILNIAGKDSEIIRSDFAKIRKDFWTYLGNEVFAKGGI